MTNHQPERVARTSVRTIYLMKAAGYSLILVAAWLIRWLISPTLPVAAISVVGMLALAPTLIIAARSDAVPPSWLTASFGIDILAITLGIHLSGGVDQVSAPLFYAALIGLIGLLLPGRAILAAAVSATAYAVMVWAEYLGVLAHAVPYSRPPDRQLATVVMVALGLFLVARVVSYAVAQIEVSAQRADELRAKSMSALSHDLKNPLAIIHGYAEMIQDAEGADQVEFARRIQRSVQQALDLVRNVLDASAIDARPIKPERVSLNFNELAGQTCEHYRPAAETKNIRLTTAFAMGLPKVDADPQLIARAIGNLVSNAVKFTEPGGTVELATGFTDNAVTVSVRDSGAGMGDAELARLFQKNANPTSGERNEGTGLGLYLVRRIAEAHNGTVGVTSVIGQGSTFTLTLPTRARNG